MRDLRVALLSSCTIELLQKPFAAAFEVHGIHPSFWVGGFGQYRQDILSSDSALYRYNPAVIVLHLDAADLFQELAENPFAFSAEARLEAALRCAGEVAALAEVLITYLPQSTVVLNTTALDSPNALTGLEYNSEYGLQDTVNAYNAELASLARRQPNIVMADIASLAASIGFENWYDCRMWFLARSRWSYKAMVALADRYAATISANIGVMRKCIVLDLDNSLWGGVVGEDGLEGLRLGQEGIGRAYVEFQLELLNLYRKGVLLAVCSKNNPDDALAVIRRHPDMRLREENFAAIRINWEDKAANLRVLAEELNIGLDSLVFIDDSPVERSRIRQAAPEVLVPDWPSDPAEYKMALLRLSARHFCKLTITTEDSRRGETYKAQAERSKLAESASSLEDFYRSLQMQAKIGLADSFTIPRIAQLTQKTNQFNLTTRRYTEAEIKAINQDPDCAIWWLNLADQFGPNGIVGVLILRRQSPDTWLIDTFLLSCRVMGRTVEDAFLAVVTRELGQVTLIGEFRPTSKNHPVRDLYPRLGFRLLRQVDDTDFWELNLSSTPLQPPPWFEIELVRSDVTA